MEHDYRRYTRIRIPEEALLACEGVGNALTGQVSVLGPGGMFIRTRDTFPAGTALEVRVHHDGDVIEVECVVRDIEPGGLGVEFTRLRGKNEEMLKKIMARFKE